MGELISFADIVAAATADLPPDGGPLAASVPVVVEDRPKRACGCRRKKRKGGLVLAAGAALVLGLGLGMMRR